METIVRSQQKNFSISRMISGTLMIAGTAIGAGMLGIPLLTAKAGFWPAFAVTLLVWIFMALTGLLLLEVCMAMPKGANILSLSDYFLGRKGKILAGGFFLFLYYCLISAYLAAGSLLCKSFFTQGLSLPISELSGLIIFFFIFAFIVFLGAKWIDRVNAVLTLALVVVFGFMFFLGKNAVQPFRLETFEFSLSLFATPVLFSAFGFHNVVPSLCGYLNKDKKALQLSIIFGTFIAFVIYLTWQWLIIGAVPLDALERTLAEGKAATAALREATGSSMLYIIGEWFAFFAITTSLLGVAFSMVDFIGDGLKVSRKGFSRLLLTFATFLPPLLVVLWNPMLFDKALGLAGGVGEAFLNGFIPVALFYKMSKMLKDPSYFSYRKKLGLFFLLLFCSIVFSIELKQIL